MSGGLLAFLLVVGWVVYGVVVVVVGLESAQQLERLDR